MIGHLLAIALAALTTLPALGYLGTRAAAHDVPFVLALWLLPAVWAFRAPKHAFAWALPWVFALPLLPNLWRASLPYSAERLWVDGLLAGWLLSGALLGRTKGVQAPGLRGVERWIALLGLAWIGLSIGAALRGFLGALPAEVGPGGAPWTQAMLWRTLTEQLLEHPQLDPTHPFHALWLRLEFVGVWLTGWWLGRADEALLPRLAKGATVALIAGFVTGMADMFAGSHFRGEDLLARLGAQFPRNHRPLLDHNALGSTLVALLPLALAGGIARWVRGRDAGEGAAGDPRRWRTPLLLAGPAIATGLFLLVGSRSKAALGGFAFAVPCWLLLGWGLRRSFSRRWVSIPIGLGLALAIAVQVLPGRWLFHPSVPRAVGDVLVVVRADAATRYLEQNRSAPWNAALGMIADVPLGGVGLGRFNRRLEDYRDPEAEVAFNPVNENAHNQFLQWMAEEGAGATPGLALWLLSLGGAIAVLRRRPLERGVAAALPAGLLGLTLNLQIGHSLLEQAPAYLAGGLLGLGLAGWSRGDERARADDADADRPRPAPWLVAVPALAAVAFWAAPRGPRPSLAATQFDVYAWIERPERSWGRDRVLGPDARWHAVWGETDTLLLMLSDLRPFIFDDERTLDVYLNGELLADDVPIKHTTRRNAGNPPTFVKLERPASIARGELFELRVVTSEPFAAAFYYDSDRNLLGLRCNPVTFIER